jgi:hypothetical protein
MTRDESSRLTPAFALVWAKGADRQTLGRFPDRTAACASWSYPLPVLASDRPR